MPRGLAHAWKNSGAETARVLFLYTPAGAGGFFEESQRLQRLLRKMSEPRIGAIAGRLSGRRRFDDKSSSLHQAADLIFASQRSRPCSDGNARPGCDSALAEGSLITHRRLRQAASDLMRVAARTTIALDRLNANTERSYVDKGALALDKRQGARLGPRTPHTRPWTR